MSEFEIGKNYKTNRNELVKCVNDWDGQYNYTFRKEETGDFEAIFTDDKGHTGYGEKVIPKEIEVAVQ